MNKGNCCTYETKIGHILIADNGEAVTRLSFISEEEADRRAAESDLSRKAAVELMQYLNGTRTSFTVPLAPEGTPFQQSVWEALRTIPYGETRTYAEIAAQIGNPKAFRAVGMANNRNPIAIMIPCHRVVGSGGKLVGYAGGLKLKERLLALEQKEEAGGDKR